MDYKCSIFLNNNFIVYYKIITNSLVITGNTEHDDRVSRPSTSRGGGRFTDRNNFNKKVTFKANGRGGSQFRKSWDNKTDLVNDYVNEFSNRNGPSRNNPGRRYFIIIFFF